MRYTIYRVTLSDNTYSYDIIDHERALISNTRADTIEEIYSTFLTLGDTITGGIDSFWYALNMDPIEWLTDLFGTPKPIVHLTSITDLPTFYPELLI